MGNLGTGEIFLVLLVALLVLGPQRLPQAARQMGKAMAEFRRVTGGLQAEMRDAISTIENEVKKPFQDDLDTTTPPPAPYVFEPPSVPPNPHILPPAAPTEIADAVDEGPEPEPPTEA